MGRLLRRLTHVLFWSRLDSELREEIETHRALRQAQFERDGMTPDAATRESRRRLGAVALAQDDARDLWLGSLDACRRDVRDGLRAIGRRPVFASLAVATLALAIGANLVVFTVVNALWLRPPAVPEPDRVAMVTAMHDFSGTNEGYHFGAAGRRAVTTRTSSRASRCPESAESRRSPSRSSTSASWVSGSPGATSRRTTTRRVPSLWPSSATHSGSGRSTDRKA
jgi:hypothetical protein